jgi:SecD/SecF fusion protein
MNKNFKWKVILIIGIIAFSLWKVYPPKEKINLGLDLQGGMHLVMQVELDKIEKDAQKDAVSRAVKVIRNRIDALGVAEPQIQPEGLDRIIIQLPGVTNRERALEIIKKTAHLEFLMVADDSEKVKAVKEGEIVEGLTLKKHKLRDMSVEDLVLEDKVILTGDQLVSATVSYGQYNQPNVSLVFNKEAAKIFSDVTQEAVRNFRADGERRRLAIVLDGKVITAPGISSHIPDGQGVIEGNFNYQEANDLALVLQAGALPAPVIVAEERSVGPTLGQDSITKGLRATFWGFFAVIVLVAVYYLFSGLIAIAALLINIIIVMGMLAACGAALTLPGIAGIILTIGMAVDANVLVFERIREEIRTGKTTRSAISSGYHRAYGTILDANITTLITALILFYFGTGPIRGFAVTLSIGIVSSFFTALFVTRVIFDFFTRDKKELNLKMFSLFPAEPKIDFCGKRFIFFGVSIAAISIGLFSFFTSGQEKYSIDFTGGTIAQVKFVDPVDISSVRSALSKKGLGSAQIQTFGERESNEILIRTGLIEESLIRESLVDFVGEKGFEIERIEMVGPAVGKDLRNKAMQSVFWALVAILVYVGWRFRSVMYGFAAVVALFHDVLIAIGALSLTGREFSLSIIAALLTIVGYSLNDTIVIFDRIREDKKLMKRSSFVEIVNASVNQTLSRTIMTSLTTLIVVVLLFVFGGEVINDFAFTLLVGIVVGTYSSVYVASPLLIGFGKKK